VEVGGGEGEARARGRRRQGDEGEAWGATVFKT
jgi:hypothetical protein